MRISEIYTCRRRGEWLVRNVERFIINVRFGGRFECCTTAICTLICQFDEGHDATDGLTA